VTLGGKVFLDLTRSDSLDYEDNVILTVTGDFDGSSGYFYNPFFALTTEDDGETTVNKYLGYEGAIASGAEDHGYTVTRNYKNAAALMEKLDWESELAGDLRKIILIAGDENVDGYHSELLLKQLIGESTLNVRQAVAETVFKGQGVVLGRLDKIHAANGITPPAADSGGYDNRVWIGGFGSWAKQSQRDDVAGYKYNSGGFALGYDFSPTEVPGLTLGADTAFSFGEVKNDNDLGKIDVDTVSLGIYGGYEFDNGVFVDGNIAYGHAKNDSKLNVAVLGAQKTGQFNIDSWQFGARVGKIIEAQSVSITPSVGLRVLTLKQDGWTESVIGAKLPGNWFSGKNETLVDIPLQVKLGTEIETSHGLVIPELRLGWTYAAKTTDNSLTMGFVGSSESTEIFGVKPGRSTFQAGTGVKVKSDNIDLFVNYDLDASRGYQNHSASIGFGFDF
jgi:outer membrane autotransporter protein